MVPPVAEADTYQTPEHGWVCFHCGEHFPGNFAGARAAQEHFGAPPDGIPGCRLRMRAGEKSLLRRIRWLERQLRELRAQVVCEDTEKDRELRAMAGAHALALREAEETGYTRGVRDMRNEAGG
jgi:hypothetical protein